MLASMIRVMAPPAKEDAAEITVTNPATATPAVDSGRRRCRYRCPAPAVGSMKRRVRLGRRHGGHPTHMPRRREPKVAASSDWVDEDGIRQPRGDTHAWLPGANQTLCGLPLHRARLARFHHVLWADALWLADTSDQRIAVCPRCVGAAGGRRDRPRWTRVNPRP